MRFWAPWPLPLQDCLLPKRPQMQDATSFKNLSECGGGGSGGGVRSTYNMTSFMLMPFAFQVKTGLTTC